MKNKLPRRSSHFILLRRTSRHATLVRTYSLPATLYPNKKNSMRRRQGKDPSSTEDQRICTKENCLTCCKKFTAFMFSRVGLFFVMMGYVAIGGVLFQELEAKNESNMRHIMHDELNLTLHKLWTAILRVNSLPEMDKKRNFSSYATDELEKFEKTVIQQVQKGFDGRTADSDHDWNYFGAVLYAVTLVSTIGYGHITTKTIQGKIATILYSAFGIPLMMLFVANIGSTMAKMFAFVFGRITMIFCCRMSAKKKRALALKNRQNLAEKADINNTSIIVMDEKMPMLTEQTKSSMKPVKDESLSSKQTEPTSNSLSITSSATDIRSLPADVRLNMLTGISSTSTTSRSLTSSTNSIGEKSKDAIVRMNELIRRNSEQDIEENEQEEEDINTPRRRKSMEINPIQYYIEETNKLTSNLNTPLLIESIEKVENEMKQVVPPVEVGKVSKKEAKKNLKRSKSETSHNRQTKKSSPPIESPSTKSVRRPFFSRKSGKSKTSTPSSSTTTDKSPTPPPPDYELPTINEITPLPSSTTVTWKGQQEYYPTIDLTNTELDDEFDDEDEEMSVPLLVTVFVIPLYLTLGATLFMTTIGFGDFVPGVALKNAAEKEKLISAAAYILFGLVLIAMCVNLMKEQLSQKVKRVANKLGRF